MGKKIAILGSTGSVGVASLEVARHLQEEIEVEALAARSNIALLEKQALQFRPKVLAVYEKEEAWKLQKRLPHIEVLAGMEGLEALAGLPSVDFVLLAISGSIGLNPAIGAIRAGKQMGIATKEILVSAGEFVTKLAREKGVELLPVDSELSAIFQCLKGEKSSVVKRLVLTASGGPFLNLADVRQAKVEDAIVHPNFQTGPKAGVDSSTLMNKGLEMIEAKWLFDIAPEKIEAVIHPEQKIQSCVEFIDGNILALISEPDMTLPIQYAMTYPERRKGKAIPYDFVKGGTLTFSPPDTEKFRCFKLAVEVLRAGRSYPCFLNAANEVLVERFLNGQISWMEIGTGLEKLISSHEPRDLLTLEAILETDGLARTKASLV